jgi:PAS domain S-box-containing protein
MERILKQMLQEAPDAVIISDREGTIIFWNSGAEQMFGHSSNEATGKSLDLIIPENLRGKHWEGYHRVMASGVTKYQTGHLSSPGIRKDGSRLSLEFSMVLLRDQDDKVEACGAIMRDVTERWNREKDLKQRLALCEGKDDR